MRTWGFILSMLLLWTGGCQRQPPPGPSAKAEPRTQSVTNWTDRTELFMEYPPLVAGQTGRWAVHLTRLDQFKPVDAGRVEVRLQREGQAPEVFGTDGPSRPGLFGVDVQPKQPGPYTMTVGLRSGSFRDEHQLGTVIVYTEAQAAAGKAEEKPQEETIAFRKEQQWSLDFATAVVGERRLHDSVRVPAEVVPRTGGAAEVTAPFDGRLVARAFPPLGTRVSQGQELAGLWPPTSTPADRPTLELAQAEAEAALALARKDRERVQRLLEVGAVPARRVDEARTVETTATARLEAAQARLAQYEATRRAEGGGSAARVFALRAPITGVIAEARTTPGANIKAGERVFKIVDVDTVYVAGHVPEADAPRVRQRSGAELEVPGADRPQPLHRLISVGRLIDPKARTLDILYEVDNRDHRLAVGQAVFLRLLTSTGAAAPVVPESAVVDDGGRPVVFVQVAGEAFARRPVRLGHREADAVQVLEGLRPRERVVTRGAYLIRLAALSNQIPAHGHVH